MDSFFFRKHIALHAMLAIGYIGSKSFVLANQTADKKGCLLLIDAIVNGFKFVLINIYNSNTESH